MTSNHIHIQIKYISNHDFMILRLLSGAIVIKINYIHVHYNLTVSNLFSVIKKT